MKNKKHSTTKNYGLIGAPQTKGGDPHSKGVANLPMIMRNAGIVDIIKACDAHVLDFGDAFERDDHDDNYDTNEYAKSQDNSTTSRYVKNCLTIGKNCEKLYNKVIEVIDDDKIPIVFGGDHGIATGSIAGSLKRHPDLIVLFVDAHTDINTPDTTAHGNYQGMPLAHLSGILNVKGFEWMDKVPILKPENICYIAIRALYQVDKDLIEELGIPYYTMHDINRQGIGLTLREALDKVDPSGTKPIHLSFDIDSCDYNIAPATIGPIEGGLSYSEALYLAHFVNATGRMVSMDLVEINSDYDIPTLDHFQPRLPIKTTVNATVKLAINLISNIVMGKGIIAPKGY